MGWWVTPRYISEIIKEFIVQGKERFPELFTYQADWLAHIDEFGLNPSYTVSYTGQSIYAPNTLEKPVKSAILSGSTKYRDIDTGEFLETFEEGRNLELVSVKMPVLTTSNEDGTKTNILTVNEDIELRGIGDVQDTLDLLTGELTERVGEIVLDGSEDETYNTVVTSFNGSNNTIIEFVPSENLVVGLGNDYTNAFLSNYNYKQNFDKYWIADTSALWGVYLGVTDNKTTVRIIVADGTTDAEVRQHLQENPLHIVCKLASPTIKTVDLSILDQNGQNVKQLMSFNGGTHFNTGSLEGSPLPSVTVTVETDLEETLKVCSLEGNTM